MATAAMAEQLAEHKAKIDAWTTQQRKAMEALRTGEEATAAALQAEVARLQEAVRSAGERARAVQETLAKERAELDALRAEIAAADAAATTTTEEVERLRAAVEARRAALAAQRAVVSERARDVDGRVAALRALEGLYANALGLRFESAGAVLRVVYTAIDGADPARKCSFELSLVAVSDAEQRYHVDNCLPFAPAGLAVLVAALNDTGDLAAFFAAMRSRFATALTPATPSTAMAL